MMEELFENAPAAADGGRILIVDDDPVVAGMLGVTLAAAGHRIVEVNSGEEALALLADARGAVPEIVFLDIEMGMGIDGYETCRRLRAIDAARDLPVIFLSGHDDLEDRLRAYDAGGSDFMAKPFVPDEVVRKANLAIGSQRRQRAAAVDRQTSFGAAMTALTTLGESGVTLKFSRGALACHTLDALARLMIDSLGAFGLECHVQIRVPGETLTMTPGGVASPLEVSVIEKMHTMDRVFSFRNRTIINFDSVSLLITNMPVDDEALCGRIRDHAAMIAEAADLAAANVGLRLEAIRRSDELRRLAAASREAVEELRVGYRDLYLATRVELESMVRAIEGMYVRLALTDQQEFTISDTVRGAVDRVLALFARSSQLDRAFAGIADSLTRAGGDGPEGGAGPAADRR